MTTPTPAPHPATSLDEATRSTIVLGAGEASSTSARGLPGRFELRYHPTHAFETGEVVACEALLRWRHPRYGLLRPYATLTGTRWAQLLLDSEHWIIEEVCRQAAAWRDQGLHLPIAVNISHQRLEEGGVTEELSAALEAADLGPGDLSVDLDVWTTGTDVAALTVALSELADLGVGVALQPIAAAVVLPDVLHHAITALKVPILSAPRRSQPTPHPRVLDAVRFARRSNLELVAASIEHPEQIEVARSVGIERGFGYLLSPVVGADELARLVRDPVPQRRLA